MTTLDHARLRELAEKATRGPWRWTDHRVPDLVGRGGNPEVYEYDIEVIDAEHYGECGCRSACELNLNVGPFDAEFIAAFNPETAKSLLDEIERLRGEGTRWFTAAYRARNGNIIPLGVENTQRGEAEHTVEEFRREDPTGPEYFVATRVQRPWEPVPEGEVA